MGEEADTPAAAGSASDDEERRRRVAALHSLAGGQTSPSPPDPIRPPTAARRLPGTAAPTRRGPRWPRVAAAAVILVAVVAGFIFWRVRHVAPTVRAIPDFVAMTFGAPGGPIGCPSRAAWSPDGRRVAVAGYAACGAGNLGILDLGAITGDALATYDTTTGHVASQTSLDALIVQGVPAAVRGDPQLRGRTSVAFQQILWSPDGHAVALTFTTLHEVHAAPNTTALASDGGGLIIVPDTGQPRVFPMPPPAGSVASEPPGAPLRAVRWDLAAGTMTAIQVPQALGYTWTATDQLVADPALTAVTPTSTATVARGPIGNPDGGTHFSIWQSGQVGNGSDCSQISPGAPSTCCAYLSAAFGTGASWSPDGRALIVPPNQGVGLSLPLATFGRLVNPPGVTGDAGSCAAGGTSGLPYVPLRDAALASVAIAVAGQASTTYGVSWRPDGARLAAYQNGLITGDTPLVTIYDTRTGGVVARITSQEVLAHAPPTGGGFGGGPQLDQTAWSPDGLRLLVLSQGELTVLLVGPRPLGG